MRTVDEFMIELSAYFGGFRTEAVMREIANELVYVEPHDLDKLMRQLKLSLTAAYQPDLKAIMEAVKAAKIVMRDNPGRERTCPSCGKTWYTTGVCPWCNYDRDRGDTPEEWRAFVEAHRSGKGEHFDVAGILRDLYDSKLVKVEDERRRT